MILQSLAAYFDRLTNDSNAPVAPMGLQKKTIDFVIVVKPDGRFHDLQDLREGKGAKKTGRIFTVPHEVTRTANIKPNLLWDNKAYVLGLGEKDPEMRLDSFIQQIREFLPLTENDPGAQAVAAFYTHDRLELEAHPYWDELAASSGNISFRLLGDSELVCQRPEVLDAVASIQGGDGPTGFCLVSGSNAPLERIHAKIKGVWGGQPSGGNLVAFNFPAALSQGKTQSFNAPVSARSAHAYITSLNTMLDKGSKQRLQVGDTSTVFWAETPHRFETQFGDFFQWEAPKGEDPKDLDDVRALLKSPQSGQPALMNDETRFFVLGLSPNSARISVRFWHPGTVRQVARRIEEHFEDLSICRAPWEPGVLPLGRLLRSTAFEGKLDNVPPKLAGDLMRSILDGTPYPQPLLTSVLRRIRAEAAQTQGRRPLISHSRAALIKAVLVRHSRYYHSPFKEVSMSLDPTNVNPGYLLGRLFAVLERAQERAHPGINATIRNRFYGAASARPASAFQSLLRLKNHHLAKLENKGEVRNLEKLIGEIMSGLDDLPATLDLMDQGRFALGYYHQRHAGFARPSEESGLQS